MLTVYGLSGRIFSGNVAGLRELGPVQAVARLRAVEPLRRDAEPEPGVQWSGPAPGTGLAALVSPDPRPQAALAAYAQTQAQAQVSPQVLPGQRQPLSLTEQVMSRRLLTVPLSARLGQALELLAVARVGQAPVLNEQGRLVGLLLRADLLPLPADWQDAESWARWLQRPVAELMWSPVPAARPDTPLREAAQALLDLRLPGLPVLDDAAELVGFLSRSDILRALSHDPPLDLWG